MTTLLVEGNSDQVALEVFARRLRLDIPHILAIGGAHAAARVASDIHEHKPNEYLIGLVDVPEQRAFTGVIDQVFVCDRDLEDELIRALGVDTALNLLDGQGELGSFGTLQKQPAQRGRNVTDQLRQFLHGRSGNKAKYAEIFAEAIELERIPTPILNVLAAATEK